MAIFEKMSPMEKLRGEITTLEARRAALNEQRAGAATNLETARAAARDALIGGDDAYDDGAVVAAERRLTTVDDALAEIARRIEDAGAALAEAEDKAAREDEAKAREAVASKIEQIAVRLERAIGEVVATANDLRDEIPGCLQVRRYDQILGDAGKLDAQQVINATIAEAMFAASPDIFEVVNDRIGGVYFDGLIRLHYRRNDGMIQARCPISGPLNFRPASGVVDALIAAPLRLSAILIRAGELPADAPAAPQPIAQVAEAAE